MASKKPKKPVLSSNLQSDLMNILLVGNLLVEGNQAAEEVLTLVVVRSDLRSLKVVVTIKLKFLTYDTGALQNDIGYGLAVKRQSLNLIERLGLCSNSGIQDALSQSNEILVVGNKVSLALKGDDSTEVTVNLNQYATLGSLTVRTLCSNCQTLLADYPFTFTATRMSSVV